LVVGNRLLGVGRIELGRRRDQRDRLVGRDRDTQRWSHHARRRLDLVEHLGWRRRQIDDRHAVGRRIGRDDVVAVDQDGLAVIGGDRKLGGGGERQQRQGEKRGRDAAARQAARHDVLPTLGLGFCARRRLRRAAAAILVVRLEHFPEKWAPVFRR